MMDSKALPNPFTPGTGAYPPVLAGRDAEKTALLEGLTKVSHPTRGGPANILLLSAPRGMGKTVLLSWLRRQAADRAVRVIDAKAGDIPDLAALGGALWPESRDKPSQLTGIKAGIVSAEWQPGQADRAASHIRTLLREHLLDATERSPLLVQVDEAHTLVPEVANALCNLAQSLIEADRPTWVVLAGTPGLLAHLMSASVQASFIERADVLSPDCLSREASIAALEIAEWRDWQIDGSVLAQVADDSQGFPFFIQRWGHALWNAGKGTRTVSIDAMESARTEVDFARRGFYARRYREIHDHEDARLVTAAAALANALSSRTSLSLAEATSAIKEVISEHAEAVRAREHLESVGFIHMRADEFTGGIPSLLRYVADQEP